MTVSRQPDSPAIPEVIVRDYAEGDYNTCRSLWKELTEYHRSIYGDPGRLASEVIRLVIQRQLAEPFTDSVLLVHVGEVVRTNP